MLSAFTPHPLVELKQRDKSRIESVLAHGMSGAMGFRNNTDIHFVGDRLLVGLSTGSLRVYRINEPIDDTPETKSDAPDEDRQKSQPGPKPVDLLREEEKFSKYKIEQLAIIKEANVLLSLSNSNVNIHDLQSYELQETLQRSKGASAIAVTTNIVNDFSSGVASIVSRLAVAVKRRLIIWSWHDGELEPGTSELVLATGIKTLTWATGTKLIAGLNSSYVLVDVETSAITDIIGPGSIGGAPGQDGGRFGGAGVASMGYLGVSAPKPLATKLGEGEMLLAKDINTIFIDLDGNSLGRRQIPWSVAPEAVGYSYPYLLALQATKGTLELRNPETLTLLQTLPLPSACQLHVPQPNVSLTHAGKGFLALSERCIWRMKALDYDSQIDALVERGRLDEAISLLGMLEDALLRDKESRMREVKILKAHILFNQRKYRDSIDLFTEVSAPPEKVISMFPPFIAGDAAGSSEGHDHLELRYDGTSDGKPESLSQEPKSKNEFEDGPSTKPLVTSGPPGGEKPLGKNYVMASSSGIVLTPNIEGKDLKTATEELRGFLVSSRTKMKKVLNTDGSLKTEEFETLPKSEIGALLIKHSFNASSDQEQLLNTAKLIDTTLFRAYMFVSPSFAGPLFRIDNFCDPDVVKEKLIEAGRYNDLVDFFYGKKLHREALELLKQFGDIDKENEDAPQLSGPQRTVAYLQNLPAEMIDLILQYSEWTLRRDAELSMEIFMADSENAENLPRPAVLDFLQGINMKLAVRYLEHIIRELNDDTPIFHQKLVDIYLRGLSSDDFAGDSERAKWKEKTLDFLRNSRYYHAYKALAQLDKDGTTLL